jgi:hypothetical protein
MNPNTVTLTVLPASVVLTHFLGEEEYYNVGPVFYSDYADQWTFGDTQYSLVDNGEFQYALQKFLSDYTSKVATMDDVRKFDSDYWELVDDCYIALGD